MPATLKETTKNFKQGGNKLKTQTKETESKLELLTELLTGY